MKRIGILLTALVLSLGLLQTSALAGGRKGGPGQGRGANAMRKAGRHTGFMDKTQLIYRFKDELGLTEEQVTQIEETRSAFKKEMIKLKAEIDVLTVDIKNALRADDVDVDAVNPLIDQKYDLKKAKAKKTVAVMAELKSVLTEEQKAKFKELIKEKMQQLRKRRAYRRHHQGGKGSRFGHPRGEGPMDWDSPEPVDEEETPPES
jgi:Spy/CpxP family protein refolding chaperone